MKIIKKIFGLIQILLSAFWIYQILDLYISYNTPGLLFAFRFPNWVLIEEVVLSIINILFGIGLILDKSTFKVSILVFISSIIIGYLVNNFYYLLH